MKTIAKLFLWLVGIVVLVAGAGLAYMFIHYPAVPAAGNSALAGRFGSHHAGFRSVVLAWANRCGACAGFALVPAPG